MLVYHCKGLENIFSHLQLVDIYLFFKIHINPSFKFQTIRMLPFRIFISLTFFFIFFFFNHPVCKTELELWLFKFNSKSQNPRKWLLFEIYLKRRWVRWKKYPSIWIFFFFWCWMNCLDCMSERERERESEKEIELERKQEIRRLKSFRIIL